jgi:transcriptional regulator with XRE-family HTH domain
MSQIIATRRRALQLTARDIQRRGGIDIGTVSLYERGRIQSPKLETLVKLAIALELPLEALLQPYLEYVRATLRQ